MTTHPDALAQDSDLDGLDVAHFPNIVQARITNAQVQLYERLLDQKLQQETDTPEEIVAQTATTIAGLRAAIKLHKAELKALPSS